MAMTKPKDQLAQVAPRPSSSPSVAVAQALPAKQPGSGSAGSIGQAQMPSWATASVQQQMRQLRLQSVSQV